MSDLSAGIPATRPGSTTSRLGGWPGALLALGGGALAPLGFAPFSGLTPFDSWPLAIISALVLLISLQHSVTAKQAILRGWLYGVGFYAIGVSWVYVSINQFGNAPPLLAGLLTTLFVLAMALFSALHGWLYHRLVAHHNNAVLLGFPAVWVLAEWFRSWFLTGFPWLYLGYAPIDSGLAGWAPITGVLGLSALCALIAAALHLWYRQRSLRTTLILMLSLLPIPLGNALQTIEWTHPSDQPPLKVALIQGNIPQQLKWHPGYREQIIEHYLDLSRSLLPSSTTATSPHQRKPVDLIVWPETAMPMLYQPARERLTEFEQQLKRSGVGLISGIPYQAPAEADQPERFHNSIMAIGDADGLYHKQRLVPFGEYVPLEQWLRGLIDFFDLPMSNFSLGPSDQPPITLEYANSQLSISASICYEIVYPDLVADSTSNSELLLTISNDSWFGDSLAPHQHLQMARMRALETGRPLIRATNNGISALVGPKGQLLNQGPQFQVDILHGEVQPMQGSTPFGKTGSWPIVLLCGLILTLQNRSALRPNPNKKAQTN